jgi:hypothetical protein
MNDGHTDHDGAKVIDGPAGYNGMKPPSKSDLAPPVKEYPYGSKLGKNPGSVTIEGPCTGKSDSGYHK